MSESKSNESTKTLGAILFLLLLPIVVLVLLLRLSYSIALYLLVWTCWLTSGKDILFVYSNSPHWHEFIEAEIIPRIKHRSVVLNWSERGKWLDKFSLSAMIFRHFGGDREFNPIGIYFRPFRLHITYRFWQPFRDWKKKGDRKNLDLLLSRFYTDTGI